MSDKHEHEVVPVEVAEDHDVVEPDVPAEPESEHSPVEDVDEDAPASATSTDLQAEQYARACADPEFAAQYAIVVDEDDQGPAWEHGSLAQYELTQQLQAQAQADDADDDGEV